MSGRHAADDDEARRWATYLEKMRGCVEEFVDGYVKLGGLIVREGSPAAGGGGGRSSGASIPVPVRLEIIDTRAVVDHVVDTHVPIVRGVLRVGLWSDRDRVRGARHRRRAPVPRGGPVARLRRRPDARRHGDRRALAGARRGRPAYGGGDTPVPPRAPLRGVRRDGRVGAARDIAHPVLVVRSGERLVDGFARVCD
ncbi:hypothetical protein GCM10025864_25080 [Luteimicrobium album]|uniref:Uncharacterized protein n=1 Tax=Luteimicrobium album TaxID=1054550 RepID=A0ABQ6I439_9MICO|nr:hypothetical protein GCM10025864_25080 [Luteimicrobium album]